MQTLSTLLAGALLSATACAQGVITRIGSDGTRFTYDGDLQAVLTAASAPEAAGVDTIILPGVVYNLPTQTDLVVTSPVVLIGTGLRNDSSAVYGGRTEIIASIAYGIRFMPGSSGSELHGISLPGRVVRFGNSVATSDVDSIRMVRCELGSVIMGSLNQSSASNIQLIQCVLGGVTTSGAVDVLISNCFLGSLANLTNGLGLTITNCIILNWIPASVANALFSNNIILRDSNNSFSVTAESNFVNNLYVGSGAGFSIAYSGVLSQADLGAIGQSGLDGIFILPPAVNGFSVYAQNNVDYHVLPTYENSGSDGTAIGVYGGPNPWKEGSIPFNPHWIQLNAPGSTSNGVLSPVQIKASAQTN